MGWWSDHKAKGISFDSWAKKKYFHDDKNFKHEVVQTGLVDFNTGYLACKRTVKKTGESYIYCMVVLLRWRNNPYQNVMVKEVDETCGPCEAYCPKKVFNILSPIADLNLSGDSLKWAQEWRNRVTEYHNKLDKWNSVKKGDTVHFTEPLHFLGGVVLSDLKVYNKRKGLFIPEKQCRWDMVKVTKNNIINRDYDIIH